MTTIKSLRCIFNQPWMVVGYLLVASSILMACGGGTETSSGLASPNHPPTAIISNPGTATTVAAGTMVTLDGSSSSDVDRDPLSYRWAFNSRPMGSAASFSNPNSARPDFTPDMAGSYVVQFIVNDGKVDSRPVTVSFTVTAVNRAPVANAGANQTVPVGMTVTLNGSGSSDPDGNAITYAWTLTSRPNGSAVTLTNPATVNPMLRPDVVGAYVASLTVSDGTLTSTAATVTITATAPVNRAPVANAGAAQTVMAGTMVILNGSASSDPDGNPITYAWTLTSRPIGSNAAIANAITARPSFTADVAGNYVAQLIVNDGTLSSIPVTVTITATAANRAPVANAGPNQSVNVGTQVILNGSDSADPDGNTITYAWTLTSRPTGSTATLASATTARPTFTPDVDGSYAATLVVNDGTQNSMPANVMITATVGNRAPVANAGTAQTVLTGTLVTLNGSGSSDPDNNSITYVWSFTARPTGSTATLTGATTARPTFTPDVAGSYVAQLIVNDGTLNSAPATVTISANANRAPVASAGPAQTVNTAALVTLNGSGSNDPDGSTITYSWSFTSRPAGSAATLANATSAQPTFTADVAGNYVAQLIVNDGTLASSPASVTITARANQAPVANAGTAQTVTVGTLVTLNGTGSTDPDGNTITYAWSLFRPTGSVASLANATSVSPTFTPDVAGAYTAQLIVSDGSLNSTATVVITANPANRAPVANAGPDAQGTINLQVTLNGTVSSDLDGNPLTYVWTLPTRPTGSVAVLVGPTTARPTFTPDVAGAYIAQLVVNDGQINSAADTVTITVSAPPVPVVSCDSLKSEFQTVTWGQVLRPSCVNCHAGVSAFLLYPETTAGFNDLNFNSFKVEAAKNGSGNVPLILRKATNQDPHSGGAIMAQGSANYLSLSDMINKTRTCTTAVTTGVIHGSGYNRLRKATLGLAGRLPTAAEEAAVNAAGTEDAAITSAINILLDAVMTENAFYTRVKEIYNDMLLTDYYNVNTRALAELDKSNFANVDYFESGNLSGYSDTDVGALQRNANYGVAKAPLELVAHVVRNNRPFTEIVTANYVMVNSYSATIYGAIIPGFTFTNGDAVTAHDPNEFREARLTDMNNRVYEHSGILSSLPFLGRYPSTSTNRNRARTRYTYLYFLDTDIQGLADRSGLDFSNVIGTVPTLTDPQCTVCHNVMDPVAGLYKNWSTSGTFRGNATWYSTAEMRAPGFTAADRTTTSLPSAENATALQFLGRNIAADGRFAVATVKTVLRGLMGRDAAQDAALVEQLSARFVSGGYNFKSLIKDVVASNSFKAINLGVNENPDNYVTVGAPILSTPEQLDRKVAAIFGGYQWRSPSGNMLSGDTFRLLYGGINSMEVTVRTQEPTSVMASIQERIAYQTACSAVPTDFARAASSRVLFPGVVVTDIPDNAAGTDRIKQNIIYLHKRILGEELSVTDPEITRTYNLFEAVWNSTTGTTLPTDCGGGAADTNRTMRSWMAVVSYLMMDYKFLFE